MRNIRSRGKKTKAKGKVERRKIINREEKRF